VFAATDDQAKMFAWELSSGEQIWETALPATAQATPMTYESNGRQFVVIAAGGEDSATGKPGDYVIAFSLR
jgi:quinoprotein glucose dehydrogenase